MLLFNTTCHSSMKAPVSEANCQLYCLNGTALCMLVRFTTEHCWERLACIGPNSHYVRLQGMHREGVDLGRLLLPGQQQALQ